MCDSLPQIPHWQRKVGMGLLHIDLGDLWDRFFRERVGPQGVVLMSTVSAGSSCKVQARVVKKI